MHKFLDEHYNTKIHPGDISKVIHKISSGKALILSYTPSYALYPQCKTGFNRMCVLLISNKFVNSVTKLQKNIDF